MEACLEPKSFMTIKVKFFAYFRDLFGAREKDVEVGEGRPVRHVLDTIADTAERRGELFAGIDLRPHLVVMINGRHIHSLQGLDTPLAAGDVVAVFPFLGGG